MNFLSSNNIEIIYQQKILNKINQNSNEISDAEKADFISFLGKIPIFRDNLKFFDKWDDQFIDF